MTPPPVVLLKLDQRKLPAEVYGRLASRAGSRRERERDAELAWENFGKPGRDPATLGGVLGIIAAILGLTGKKAAMTVGIISLIAALAALVYGYAATVSFTGHTVQAAGAIVLAVAAVLMVYGAAAAKKAPVTAQ